MCQLCGCVELSRTISKYVGITFTKNMVGSSSSRSAESCKVGMKGMSFDYSSCSSSVKPFLMRKFYCSFYNIENWIQMKSTLEGVSNAGYRYGTVKSQLREKIRVMQYGPV